VFYHRDTEHVVLRNGETNTVPCYGSIEVFRDPGVLYFGPGSPGWYQDYCGIYFKNPTNSATDFYFRMSRKDVPVSITEARGVVRIEGRSVLFDIHYKDSTGSWHKPPINGRHKIDRIFPDENPPSDDLFMNGAF
jgi:hypothetical protein